MANQPYNFFGAGGGQQMAPQAMPLSAIQPDNPQMAPQQNGVDLGKLLAMYNSQAPAAQNNPASMMSYQNSNNSPLPWLAQNKLPWLS